MREVLLSPPGASTKERSVVVVTRDFSEPAMYLSNYNNYEMLKTALGLLNPIMDYWEIPKQCGITTVY